MQTEIDSIHAPESAALQNTIISNAPNILFIYNIWFSYFRSFFSVSACLGGGAHVQQVIKQLHNHFSYLHIFSIISLLCWNKWKWGVVMGREPVVTATCEALRCDWLWARDGDGRSSRVSDEPFGKRVWSQSDAVCRPVCLSQDLCWNIIYQLFPFKFHVQFPMNKWKAAAVLTFLWGVTFVHRFNIIPSKPRLRWKNISVFSDFLSTQPESYSAY